LITNKCLFPAADQTGVQYIIQTQCSVTKCHAHIHILTARMDHRAAVLPQSSLHAPAPCCSLWQLHGEYSSFAGHPAAWFVQWHSLWQV